MRLPDRDHPRSCGHGAGVPRYSQRACYRSAGCRDRRRGANDTGTRFETFKAADGLYVIPLLPPSAYGVVAEAPGFKRYERSGVQLGANERGALDVQLEVGAITETVWVTAAPVLTTPTSSSGQVISTGQIENMPLSGRRPLAMAQNRIYVTPNRRPSIHEAVRQRRPERFLDGSFSIAQQ
jgi:hypothetical protein